MRVDYDLTRLGTREFEHLTQALAIKILGAGVSVFGDGRDGGREASFTGSMSYPHPDPGEPWDGYGVLQAKFHQRPRDPASNAAWLSEQINGEGRRWRQIKLSLPRAARFPRYMVFATNVVLSAVPGSGGIDKVGSTLDTLAGELGLAGWALWHYDQICRFLDDSPEIRRTYAALTTPGDVLSKLADVLDESHRSIGSPIARHATKALIARQYVRLDQAGDDTNSRLPLSLVGIDLPATSRKSDVATVAEYVISRGNQVLRPSRGGPSPHIVLIGGPGQGKTTIGQLLCQVFRVALLESRPTSVLGPQAAEIYEGLRAAMSRLELPDVTARRWPIEINLSAYGDAVAVDEHLSLLAYIAAEVTKRGEVVTVEGMRAWLRDWSWLVLLDGLDEVAAASTRLLVTERIDEFLVDIGDLDADVLIVATTRPQGYSDQFSPRAYEHLQLRPLNTNEAIAYAQRLAEVRHGDDADTVNEIVQRLRTAAREPATARLMQSPLQVTIMSLLLERRSRAPRDRYALFAAYYDTIYAREVAKPGETAELLDEQRTHVNALHEAVALRLHVQAEHAAEAESVLLVHDLLGMARQRLQDEGHPPSMAIDLAQRLVDASTTRLVLLVPLRQGSVGFEVRSLQEFMAACSVTNGESPEILARLAPLIISPHWRNTWLLAAGRLFSEREHMRSDLMTLIERYDQEGVTSPVTMPGAGLAVDLLGDDVAIRTPHFQTMLTDRALRLLRLGPGLHVQRLAQELLAVAQANPTARALIDRALDASGENTGREAVAAVQLLAEWADSANPPSEQARTRLETAVARLTTEQQIAAAVLVDRYAYRSLLSLRARIGTADTGMDEMIPVLQIALNTADVAGDPRRLRSKTIIADVLRNSSSFPAFDDGITAFVTPALASDGAQRDVAWAVVEELAQLSLACAPRDWTLAAYLRSAVQEITQRMPVGQFLVRS
ncbi:hypothetical protein SAMN05660733_07732 [Lentzea albidocapillata]|uniref:NACHT domain-containing protein n=1 Tax=Lentzea albidocapillata TaxID=40571 RepID=A0A1W2FRT0_9PSEU|nr:hypothetical protein SAMN05660733_07732 [Lentzea albidocapillata]